MSVIFEEKRVRTSESASAWRNLVLRTVKRISARPLVATMDLKTARYSHHPVTIPAEWTGPDSRYHSMEPGSTTRHTPRGILGLPR